MFKNPTSIFMDVVVKWFTESDYTEDKYREFVCHIIFLKFLDAHTTLGNHGNCFDLSCVISTTC